VTQCDELRSAAGYAPTTTDCLVYAVNSQRINQKMQFAHEMIFVAEGPDAYQTEYSVTLTWWNLADGGPPHMKVEFYSRPLEREWLAQLLAALRPDMTPEQAIRALDGLGAENVSRTDKSRSEKFSWYQQPEQKRPPRYATLDVQEEPSEETSEIKEASDDRRVACEDDEPTCKAYRDLKQFITTNGRPPKTSATDRDERSVANGVSSYLSRNKLVLSDGEKAAFERLRK
jgi:hypothetical protein